MTDYTFSQVGNTKDRQEAVPDFKGSNRHQNEMQYMTPGWILAWENML